MTSTINASTSSGIVQTADTSGVLALQTGGTTAITIDASQNVGIGTSSPFSAGSTYKVLTINGTGGGQITWASNGTSKGYAFCDASNMTWGANSVSTFETNGAERMRIDSSGKLIMASSTNGFVGQLQAGITANTGSMNSVVSVAATAAGPYPFGARGENTNQGLIGFFNESNGVIGSVTRSGSNVAYNTSSDYRLKENIQPMQNALGVVAQLKPVTYTWKADGSDGQGFIAHELQAVVPDCVTGEKDAVDAEGKPVYQGIDTSFLVATLCKAIQELKAELDELKAKVTA